MSSNLTNLPYTTNENVGDTEIIVLRTWKGIDEEVGKNKNENNAYSIHSWHISLLNKAKKCIYVEDQFSFQDKSTTRALVDRLRMEKELKVVIVCPLQPNLPSSVLSLFSKETIDNINNNLSFMRKAGEGRVKTYSLLSQHPSVAEKRRQIYVHSKLMIVDDYWITIGSSNRVIKGFQDSAELDIGITSPNLALQLRTKLWNEHINNEHANPVSDTFLSNFNEGFKVWESQAKDNGNRVKNKEPIQGQIYYYNFKEMNFPSPLSNTN